jgi:hypothetical protein
MKNLIKTLALGAVVIASFTACHTREGETTTQIDNVVRTSTRVLVINTNVSASISFGGQTINGTTATFNTNANTGKVNITATGKKAVTLDIDFNGGEYLAYDITLVSEAPAVAAATAEAEGAAPVSNGDANAADNDGVTADFSVAGNSNTGTTGDYSITVFTPTEVETDIEEVKKNEQIEEPVLALDCRPDGAVFENPITVNVNIPESDGFDLGCFDENGNETTSAHTGDKLQIQLTHFSIWDIILKAKLVNDPTVDVVENVYTADASKGAIAYTFKFGFDNNAKSPLIVKYLKKLFGISARDAKKTVTFKKVEGTAKLTVKQQVTTYNFESGSQKFSVTVYGKVTENLSIEAAPEVVPVIPTHGGGSND